MKKTTHRLRWLLGILLGLSCALGGANPNPLPKGTAMKKTALSDFALWCEKYDQSGKDIQHTLNVLAQAVQKRNCMEAVGTLEKLDSLSLDDSALVDIAPIAALKNIRRLSLQRNNIRDVSPLKKMTGLRVLDLSGNQIADIGMLSTLKRLEDFRFSDNQVSDIAVVGNFPTLEYLWLNNNRVTDLSPVVGLKSLWSFSALENPITKSTQACPTQQGPEILRHFCRDYLR